MEYDKLIIVLIAGTFTLAASIVAAVIAYNRNKHLERIKQGAALKTQAYIDLIKGITTRDSSNKTGDIQRRNEADALLTDAKVRIAIYGDQDVVSVLADICTIGHATERSNDGLIKLVQGMRSEFDKNGISYDDIYRILYNAHPPR